MTLKRPILSPTNPGRTRPNRLTSGQYLSYGELDLATNLAPFIIGTRYVASREDIPVDSACSMMKLMGNHMPKKNKNLVRSDN